MKNYFYLLLLIPAFLFSQNDTRKVDYFIQFNTNEFAKKVDLKTMLNHKAFKDFNRPSAKIKMNELTNYVDTSKKMVIHGNFSDSIPYCQFSIPLKNASLMEQFIQSEIDKNNEYLESEDKEVIKSEGSYKIYSPNDGAMSMAWNNDYLVVYGLIEISRERDQYAYDSYDRELYIDDAVDAVEVVEVEDEEAIELLQEKIDSIPPPPLAPKGGAIEKPYTKSVVVVETDGTEIEVENHAIYEVEDAEDATYDNEYSYDEEEDYNNEEYDEEYYEQERLKRLEEKREKIANQEAYLRNTFTTGFSMPNSEKVNNKADISAWVNYESVFRSVNSFSYLFKSFKQANGSFPEYENSIKGMNADLYFENDQAHMVQTVEYSPALAAIMSKIASRKVNKDIYKYFPKAAPLGYMTYHINTEEMLKSYPAISEQMLSSLPIDKQDAEIITDLMATVLDEEAIATLFDGDLTMFLHDVEKYEATYTKYSYDDDYEEIEEEVTTTKTRPIFSFIMTSTHKTMADKMLNLGVRKGVLTKVDDVYIVNQNEEMGDFLIIKNKDVLVFTNGVDYLNNGKSSAFAKNVKKELKQNYMYGNVDMKKTMQAFLTSEDFGKESTKALKVANQFSNVIFKSSKKLNDNKMSFDMILKSNFSDANIVIQMLDLMEFLN